MLTSLPARFAKNGGRAFLAAASMQQMRMVEDGPMDQEGALAHGREVMATISPVEQHLLHLRKQAHTAYVEHVLSTATSQEDRDDMREPAAQVRKAAAEDEVDQTLGFFALRKSISDPTMGIETPDAISLLEEERLRMAVGLLDFAKALDIDVPFEQVDLDLVQKHANDELVHTVKVANAKSAAKAARHHVEDLNDKLDLLTKRLERHGDHAVSKAADHADALSDGKELTASHAFAELLVGKHEVGQISDVIKELNADLTAARSNYQNANAGYVAALEDQKHTLAQKQAAELRFVEWAKRG